MLCEFSHNERVYEIDVELVVSVLKAISANFADFAIYAPNDNDMMIVATKKDPVPELDGGVFGPERLAASLKRVGVEKLQDLAVRKVGTKKALGEFLLSFPVRANSDYYPVLDQNAARTRFLNSSAGELLTFSQTSLPTADILSGTVPGRERTEITPTPEFSKTKSVFAAMAIRDYLLSGRFSSRSGAIPDGDKEEAVRLRRMFYECRALPNQDDRLTSLFYNAENIIPFLNPVELEEIWQALDAGPCAGALTELEKECLNC